MIAGLKPGVLALALVLLLYGSGCVAGGPKAGNDFLVILSMVPGNWIADSETDFRNIETVANTVSMASGRYNSFQTKKLAPALDAAQRHGLKVILCYYRIQDGDTSLEELARRFGNHPAVIGFKVQDELGSHGESPQQLQAFLREARRAIRKHTDKPIMVDVVPWEFWMAGNQSYERKYPGSSNVAIDSYVEDGLVDWLIISVSERASSVPKVLPLAIKRWGDKVRVLVRTSGSFKGEVYGPANGTDPAKVRAKTLFAFANGAQGIYFYTWQHATYRLLNKDGSTNPLFLGMQETFRELKVRQWE